jgi:hypothetical protein
MIYPILNNQKLVIGVPHVGSGLVLIALTVISSILNIFIFLFIFLLIAAFRCRPVDQLIRTVTGHLRKTNLDKLDEPLLLKETNDEMGVLVRAPVVCWRNLKKVNPHCQIVRSKQRGVRWQNK